MKRYKKYLLDKTYLLSATTSFLLLLVSLIINFYAGTYATEKASSAVTDVVLSNTPVFDVDGLFVWGPVVLFIFVVLLCLHKPQKLPFVIKSTALFILVRSVFISITHIGPFPDQLVITTGASIAKDFTFGADLFFSAHTGLPFLLALIFYRNKPLRFLFIGSSILFGAVVLLAHRHYSIDVLSAFFITYTIYHIALNLFKKDYHIFNQDLNL